MIIEAILNKSLFTSTHIAFTRLVAFALLFTLTAPALGLAPLCLAGEYPVYDITPPAGGVGKEYTIVVLSHDPARRDITDKSRLIAPVGITVTSLTATSPSSLTARISIPKDAPLGNYRFLLKDKESPNDGPDDSKIIGTADFTVTVTPGLIPPGMDPEVDVMWGVMPADIVHHNFGRKIAANYYGIQIRIGNNSGWDLQLAGIGFQLPSGTGISNIVPTNSYRATRATLEREQEVGLRATVLNLAKSLGNLYTGFLPFWHVPNRSENATLWGTIINGPFEAGLEKVFPDTTVRQLTRLDDQTLRDGLILKNNSQIVTLAWVPKKLLHLSKDMGKDDPENLRRFNRNGTRKQNAVDGVKNWIDDPQYVNTKLGKLVIVGQAIQYLNRIQLIRTGEGEGETPPPSVLGTDIQAAKQGDKPTIVFSGEHLEGASIAAPTGIEFPSAKMTVDKNGHVLRAEAVISNDIKPDTYTIFVSTTGGRSNPVTLRIDAAPPAEVDYTPKTIDVTNENQNVTVTITGKFLKDAKIEPKKVENVLEVADDAKSAFDKVTQTLKVLANAKEGDYTLELQGPGGKVPLKIKLKPKAK